MTLRCLDDTLPTSAAELRRPRQQGRPGSTPEGRLKKQILDWLATLPKERAVFGNLVRGSTVGANGTPFRFGWLKGSGDILGAIDGRMVWFETKAPRGKMRDTQKWFADRMYRCGVPYFVVRSLPEVQAVVVDLMTPKLPSIGGIPGVTPRSTP